MLRCLGTQQSSKALSSPLSLLHTPATAQPFRCCCCDLWWVRFLLAQLLGVGNSAQLFPWGCKVAPGPPGNGLEGKSRGREGKEPRCRPHHLDSSALLWCTVHFTVQSDHSVHSCILWFLSLTSLAPTCDLCPNVLDRVSAPTHLVNRTLVHIVPSLSARLPYRATTRPCTLVSAAACIPRPRKLVS